MRKFISILLVLSMALCFIGCGKKTETTFAKSMDGVEETLTLHAEGDKIKRIVQTDTFQLEGLTEEMIQQMDTIIEQLVNTYNAIDGISCTSSKTDTVMTVTADMDVSKKETIKSLSEQQLLSIDNSEADYLSLKATKEGLESNGYTVK